MRASKHSFPSEAACAHLTGISQSFRRKLPRSPHLPRFVGSPSIIESFPFRKPPALECDLEPAKLTPATAEAGVLLLLSLKLS